MKHLDILDVLERLFTDSGAAGWGACAFWNLQMGAQERDKALELCPEAAGVLIAAYPYYTGAPEGNLSLYARGEDYHRVLLRRLDQICAALEQQLPGYHFVSGADNSPIPEVQAARLAGLGLQGRNGLVIVPPYGSWVFLGTILTDYPLKTEENVAPPCINCGACIAACPGGALGATGFDLERCLSELTQRKGELLSWQESLVKAHPLIWGCDICQRVCPYNRDVDMTALPEFLGEGDLKLISTLSREDVENLSNRQFREKYGERAFAWRGPGVLRRNLAWKEPEEAD